MQSAECLWAECHPAHCHSTECHSAEILLIDMPQNAILTKAHYPE
jgi:hypothetical protein